MSIYFLILALGMFLFINVLRYLNRLIGTFLNLLRLDFLLAREKLTCLTL